MESTELRIETGAELVTDLTREVERFCQGTGDGLVHVFAPHATAVLGGNVQLGTWQSVVLVDTNRDNQNRRVRISFVPG